MPVVREKAAAKTESVTNSAQGWWMPAFESFSLASFAPLGRSNAAWTRAAHEAHAAAEEAGRHWRALAELQMHVAGEAFHSVLALASAQAERRRETITHLMQSAWPAPSAAAHPE